MSKLSIELAAKVRGYFMDRYGKTDWHGLKSIPEYMDGDRDLFETASKITKKVIHPGKKTK